MRNSVGPHAPDAPLFSVVIPTYARPERLAACLAALAAVDYPRDRFEVVVSDDGSPASPEPAVSRVRDRLDVRLVRGPNAGPATARNRGAADARGRYLLFMDDDCLATPELLTALERRVAAAPDRLIGGGIENALPDNPFSTATQLIVSCVYEYYEEHSAATRFFNTSNLVVPADRFAQLGGFSDVFPLAAGEDYDFCHRWQHAGFAVTYAPEAVVHHAHPLTSRSFCRQHFNYGRGLLRCRRRIAERTGARRVEPEAAAFYVKLLRYPLARGARARGWLHAALVAVSQGATVTGVVWEAMTAAAPHASTTRDVGPPHRARPSAR